MELDYEEARSELARMLVLYGEAAERWSKRPGAADMRVTQSQALMRAEGDFAQCLGRQLNVDPALRLRSACKVALYDADA
jgi:hypothetical protein